MKTALILLADGCEETEAVTVIDLLTRAGINVTYASITSNREVHCSRGVTILAQKVFSQISHVQFDVVILPGGLTGAENYRDTPEVIDKLKNAHKQGAVIAAICATPALVLVHHNLFAQAKMTGYPSTKDTFPYWQDERAYYDETQRVLTSQGPGTSIDFALKIIDVLLGKEDAAQVASQLVLPQGINSYQ